MAKCVVRYEVLRVQVDSCPSLASSGQHRPNLAESGSDLSENRAETPLPLWGNFDPHWPLWPGIGHLAILLVSVEIGATVTQFDYQIWPGIGQTLANPGRIWPEFDHRWPDARSQIRPDFGQCWLETDKVDQSWPGIGGTTSTNIGAELGLEYGQIWATRASGTRMILECELSNDVNSQNAGILRTCQHGGTRSAHALRRFTPSSHLLKALKQRGLDARHCVRF